MKPCPFCGSPPLPVHRTSPESELPEHAVQCSGADCGAVMLGTTADRAIARWNTRPLHIAGHDARGRLLDCAMGASSIPDHWI